MNPKTVSQAALDDFVGAAVDRITGGAGRLEPASAARSVALAFNRILVPVDDSAAARNAATWARRIATTFRSQVTFVSVVEPPTLARAFFGPGSGRQEAVKKAQDGIDRSIAQARATGVRAQGNVRQGFTVRRIVAEAKRTRADLVVMGSKGAGPWARMLLGSVVDATKNEVPQSVLIAKGAGAPRRILAATDGSRESKRAIRAAFELARAWGVPLTVLYVSPRRPRESKSWARADPFGDEMPSTHRRAWRDVDASFLVLFGRPAETIVSHAEKIGADLIVIGSRGLSGLRSIVPGGVSNRVAHAAPCSVLLVKTAR